MYAYTVSLITCDSRPARLTSSITHTGHPVTFIGHNAAFTACVHTVSAVMSKSALLNKICSISIITVKLKKNENSHFKLTVYYPIVKGVVYHGCFYPTKVILRYIYSPCWHLSPCTPVSQSLQQVPLTWWHVFPSLQLPQDRAHSKPYVITSQTEYIY